MTEGVAVILRQTQAFEALHRKLLLFAVGVVCFGVPLQTGFVLVNALYRRLKLIAVQNKSGRADGALADGNAARQLTLR